jgi:Protein of unknown function (DUF4012)
MTYEGGQHETPLTVDYFDEGESQIVRALRIGVRVLVPVVLIWLVLVGYSLFQAMDSARAGQGSINRLRLDDPVELIRGGEVPDLVEAEASFRAANDHLSRPWMAPVGWLPVVGTQLASSRSLSQAGYELTSSFSDGIAELGALTDKPVSTGPARLAVLEEGAAILGELSDNLVAADLGPSSGLWGPLRDARQELQDELDDSTLRVDNALQAFGALRVVLDGPSEYLLIAANNAEMRAGSGMFLSLGRISAENGEIELGDMVPSWSVNPEVGTLPVLDADYETNWGFTSPSGEYRNLAMSPRFDVAAEQAVAMWEATHPGDDLDGVLLLDPIAIATFTESTGALSIGGSARDTDEMLQYLLNGQYQGIEDQSDRRDDLSLVAGLALLQILDADLDLVSLANRAKVIPAGRHLMIWSEDPGLQSVWDNMQIAGTLDEQSLAVSVLNRGANKLDYFTRTSARIQTVVTPEGTAVTLLVSVVNEVELEGQPAYVVGPYPNVGETAGEYVGDVAVNVPAAAQNLEFVQAGEDPRFGNDGPTVLAASSFRLLPGEEKVFEVTFTLPPESRELRIMPSARYQGIRWVYGDEAWRDSEIRRISW